MEGRGTAGETECRRDGRDRGGGGERGRHEEKGGDGQVGREAGGERGRKEGGPEGRGARVDAARPGLGCAPLVPSVIPSERSPVLLQQHQHRPPRSGSSGPLSPGVPLSGSGVQYQHCTSGIQGRTKGFQGYLKSFLKPVVVCFL